MIPRGYAAPAPQHLLVDHELAVVFADGAGLGPEARIRRIGARRPLPHVADELPAVPARPRMEHGEVEAAVIVGPVVRSDHLPLGFGRQARSGPAGEGIGFEVADMTHRLGRIDGAGPAE